MSLVHSVTKSSLCDSCHVSLSISVITYSFIVCSNVIEGYVNRLFCISDMVKVVFFQLNEFRVGPKPEHDRQQQQPQQQHVELRRVHHLSSEQKRRVSINVSVWPSLELGMIKN